MPELNVFRLVLKSPIVSEPLMEHNKEVNQEINQGINQVINKETKLLGLSPKLRENVTGSLKKTRNASIENFMKFQWSWSL